MKSVLLAIVINELMAANVGTAMSPAYNFDSWVEFYNPTEQAVDLKDCYLSNDGSNLTRWQMPADIGTVPAKGYLVVWLGSNDIKTSQAPFKLDCDGGSIYLSSPQGELITSVDYPEAMSRTAWARKTDGGDAWGWTADATPGASNATAAFCETRLDPPVVNMGSQLFTGSLNIEVTIPKGATLMYTTDCSVPMSTVTADNPVEEPSWHEFVINGDCESSDVRSFFCRDADGSGDINRITDGAGVDGSRGVVVHAIDNPEHDWSAQFFIHTPDHIWKAGEHYRFRMMARADKRAHITAQSHRTPGDYIHWQFLNNDYYIDTEWHEFTYEGDITQDQAGTDERMQTIAFNLNGDGVENNFYFDNISWESFSAPENNNVTAYQSKDGKFTVNGTTNYVFRLFKDGYLPSVPVSRSFIQTSNQYTIPVVSIVGDERYFTDPMWGIDVKGSNGITGNGSDDPVNWNQPWDRPVNFSYISPTEGMLFNQDVNISVSGGWTRSASPRSMKLKSNKVFDGQNHFDYSFFPQKPYIRNKTLLIRNGGNDVYSGSRFMDPALTTIIQRSGIDIDVQSFVQVAEYINGKFRGVLNLREPNNDKFVYANWGYDDEEIDAFENGEFKNGTDEAYNRLCQLAEDINTPGNYESVMSLLDVDEFANYMAAELYLGNEDWPGNNVKGYRSQQDGRFRFVCFDLDYSFNIWDRYDFRQVLDNNSGFKMVKLFIDLLKHDGFRRKFIDTYCIIAGSVFEKERATAIVNEMADAMRPMSQFDGKLPDNTANKIKSELENRLELMMGLLQQYEPMKLANVASQNVTLKSNTQGASLYVNDINVPYAYFNGQLFTPVTLEAKAPAGYTFTGWRKSSESTVKVVKTNDTWKYYDKGEISYNNWRENGYNDSMWKSGEAPLGYSMTGVTTTVGFGSDAQRKNPTTYFRKSFNLSAAPTSKDVFLLNYQLDDGCIVWINGKEGGRVNMRSGTVNYNTFSSAFAEGVPVTGTINLDPSLFQKGSNVIAVEVHNTSYTSSDLFWACELSTSVGGSTDEGLITEPVIDMPEDYTLVLEACFEPLSDAERLQQGITPIRINEVSADDGIYVNDYFKRKDWVELYNTTNQDIDVEGMYLSDNPDKPKKYQITGTSASAAGTAVSTTIPAHGYLIVWCDKESSLSQLHASFKLANEGGEILLTAADESWTDRFTYAAHTSDQTVGRYPDGSNQVYLMNIPTIAKTNITSSYVVSIEQPVVTGIRDMMASQPVTDNHIYNLKGQAVNGTLTPGVYIKNGRKVVIK